ncbi:MAG: antibiotic biosynthesis monooxygenase [Myxococcota bacterium]
MLLMVAACTDSESSTVLIETDPTYLMMINVWTPHTGGSFTELSDAVRRGLENDMRSVDGFLGAAVLEAQDGSNVVVYGQWRDSTAVDAAGAKVAAGEAPDFAAALSLATTEAHPYRVDSLVGEIVIDTAADELTMINTWTPRDGVSVDEVATALSEGIRVDTSAQPGFRAAGVLASLDGSNVRAYGHWDDAAALEAYGSVIEAGAAATFAQVFALATSDARPYSVVAVITP